MGDENGSWKMTLELQSQSYMQAVMENGSSDVDPGDDNITQQHHERPSSPF